jgi:hypothetical protein
MSDMEWPEPAEDPDEEPQEEWDKDEPGDDE